MSNQGFPNVIEDINDDITKLRESNKNAYFSDGLENESSAFEILNSLNIRNKHRGIIAHLNINSLRNKFDALKYLINENVDILIITETKLEDTFPSAQFAIEGYIPHSALIEQLRVAGSSFISEKIFHLRFLNPCPIIMMMKGYSLR